MKQNNSAAFITWLKECMLHVAIQKIKLTQVRRRSLFNAESETIDMRLQIPLGFFRSCLRRRVNSYVLQLRTAIWIQSKWLLRYYLRLSPKQSLILTVMFLHVRYLFVDDTEICTVLTAVRKLAQIHQSFSDGRVQGDAETWSDKIYSDDRESTLLLLGYIFNNRNMEWNGNSVNWHQDSFSVLVNMNVSTRSFERKVLWAAVTGGL
mmetsp:Transcript_53254/g.111081  ORF Transcript_53254/g.111081 Transcript_53254/m.111081 type:complete len:207 (-) Transcript_53254:1643-2263(-)